MVKDTKVENFYCVSDEIIFFVPSYAISRVFLILLFSVVRTFPPRFVFEMQYKRIRWQRSVFFKYCNLYDILNCLNPIYGTIEEIHPKNTTIVEVWIFEHCWSRNHRHRISACTPRMTSPPFCSLTSCVHVGKFLGELLTRFVRSSFRLVQDFRKKKRKFVKRTPYFIVIEMLRPSKQQ